MARKPQGFGSAPKKMAEGGNTADASKSYNTLRGGWDRQGLGLRAGPLGVKDMFKMFGLMFGNTLGPDSLAQFQQTNPAMAAKLGLGAPPPAQAQTKVPATPSRVYTPMPAGYDPAKQGEWNFYQPKATAATPMKKGGKVASKPAVKKSAKPAAKKAAPKKAVSAVKPKGKK